MSKNDDVMRIYLHGGQVIEKIVETWKLSKSPITGGLTELSWHDTTGERMPFIRLDSIDAVTIHPKGK